VLKEILSSDDADDDVDADADAVAVSMWEGREKELFETQAAVDDGEETLSRLGEQSGAGAADTEATR
jgi:hypothetical protein